mgnify:CR=1 FL=1
MKDAKYQRFPDGTPVRFTDEARAAMRGRPGITKPLPTPRKGAEAVYTVDNTDDSLHDVVLRETGERYGTHWLEEDTPKPPHPFEIGVRLREVDRLLQIRSTGLVDGYPPMVVICGSTRFRAEMADANRELTLAGCVVLAPGVFAHDGDQITEEQKTALDALHLRKIDLADEVFVVDPDGYIGESTRREIDYARQHDKPIYFLSTMQPHEKDQS